MRGASPDAGVRDGAAIPAQQTTREQDGGWRRGDGEPTRRVAVVQPAQLQPARPGRPLRSALGRSALPLCSDLVSHIVLPDGAA